MSPITEGRKERKYACRMCRHRTRRWIHRQKSSLAGLRSHVWSSTPMRKTKHDKSAMVSIRSGLYLAPNPAMTSSLGDLHHSPGMPHSHHLCAAVHIITWHLPLGPDKRQRLGPLALFLSPHPPSIQNHFCGIYAGSACRLPFN